MLVKTPDTLHFHDLILYKLPQFPSNFAESQLPAFSVFTLINFDGRLFGCLLKD
jgi:hypothetical protein